MLQQYLATALLLVPKTSTRSAAMLNETTAIVCNRELLVDIAGIDNSFMDPQLCATFACDIYNHLRASEVKKRPSTDYMEKIQKKINPSMRALLVDWLVEVAEGYSFVPETLYLSVNYIDRYLSGNPIDGERLMLLAVTTKSFLSRFVRAAQGANHELPSLHLECLASYLAEPYLLDYSMLCYAPSLTAIFLANYIMLPSKKPWNATLKHYTLYHPSDLRDCVKDLHRLCCNNQSSCLPAIREKYSEHEYKCVAEKHCPATIPTEYQV
ncbi:hypothetical protein ACLB2K_008623 [Fragaria x ananassa]